MRTWATLGLDLALLTVATVLALLLRENLYFDPSKVADLMPYLAASLVVAVPVMPMFGLNRQLWRYSVMPDYSRVLIAIACIVLGACLITFTINRMEGVARSIPILQALLAVCILVGARIAVRSWYASRPVPMTDLSGRVVDPAAKPPRDVLIVGLSTLTILYLRCVAEFARDRIRIAGIIPHIGHHAGRRVRQLHVFGAQEHLPDVLRQLAVHGVFVDQILVTLAFDHLPPRLQEELRLIENESAVEVEYLFDRLGFDRSSRNISPLSLPAEGNASTFSAEALVASTERPFWRLKRVLDAILAGLFLLLLAPLFVILTVLIAATIGFPTIFWQDRPGIGGKPFKLYKFRTMGDAHDRHGHRVPDGDRLNAIGRFLRATRLDELPQLWNILVGEMSFVGPRPLLHVDQPATYAARLLVRPGLTGWAQVTGGRQVSARNKAALDVWYVQNASLKLDLEIFARTVPMVLFGEWPRGDRARLGGIDT